jgi:hypothetical protein
MSVYTRARLRDKEERRRKILLEKIASVELGKENKNIKFKQGGKNEENSFGCIIDFICAFNKLCSFRWDDQSR